MLLLLLLLLLLSLSLPIRAAEGTAVALSLDRCPGGSTHEPFLAALGAGDRREMRRLAPCAIEIVAAVSPKATPAQLGYAIVKALLRDVGMEAGRPMHIDEEQDFDMLRALDAAGVSFSSTALREAVLAPHLPLARFLIMEIGYRPLSTIEDSWQPLHSVFMSYTLVIVAKMLLNKKRIYHGDDNVHLAYLLDSSPTFAKKFNDQKQSTVTLKELRVGVNEIQSRFLDLMLALPEFDDAWCKWFPAVKRTGRTLLHAAAAAGDPVSVRRLLERKKARGDDCKLVDIEAEDVFGLTAAELAYRSGDSISMNLLLEAARAEHGKGADGVVAQARRRIEELFDPQSTSSRQEVVVEADGSLFDSSISSVSSSPSNICNIDSIDAKHLNATFFFTHYFLRRRPLRIERGAKKWPAFKKWTRKYIDARLGNAQLEVSQIPYGRQFGVHTGIAGSLREAFATPSQKKYNKPYVFDSDILHASPRLLRDYPEIPQCMEPPRGLGDALALHLSDAQLYVGSAGSGSPLHFHEDAWNAAFRGRKEWFVLPPADAVYSTVPIKAWLRQQEEEGGMPPSLLRCTQRRGDIMFIPGTYAHGVLNTKRTIGVATEMITRMADHWSGRWD